MSNLVQIGSLEAAFIAKSLRDIHDVLQQMSVEPRLDGFRDRISRPVQRIEKLIAANDPAEPMGLQEACELLISQRPEHARHPFPTINGGDQPTTPGDAA